MTSRNVEVVQTLWQSFRDLMDATPEGAPLEGQIDTPDHEDAIEAMLARFDPGVEWDLTNFAGWPEDRIYRGHEGVRRFWRAYLSAWGEVDWVIEDFLEADDSVVVLLTQQTVGRGSGVVTDYPPYAQVWTFRDGKVVRFAVYTSRPEALRSVGIRVA